MEGFYTRACRWLGPWADPLGTLAAARGALFPWVPVCLSFGIGLWFSLRFEPGTSLYSGCLVAALVAALIWLRGPELARIPAAALMLMAIGFLTAGARAHLVAAPVLDFRYYGPIEGRIVAIGRSFSDQTRLTLDQVVLDRTDPARTPALVRVAMHGPQGYIQPEPGLRVILTGHLSPPEGPVEPGGFDFQRLAWFSRLGGVGYTRSPVLVLAPAEQGAAGLGIHRIRMRLSAAIQDRIKGQAGALASALMTGDRAGLNAATNNAMRGSNLSHLISISGLHMGLLTGFVFLWLRYGLSLIPAVALRLPVKKLAAFVALLVAGAYLALSGANVATVRAFIMVAVMLVAVLLDRRALTLRSVAIAAVLILMIEPESLVEPGFQMSFGATAALVGAFGAFGRWQSRVPRLLVPMFTLILSSLVAGSATAPIAAAHFNRVAEYGLLANFLAVPLTGILVMPAAVMAALLAPFGLEGPAIYALGLGTRAIIVVAEWVSGMQGAVFAVPTPPVAVLPVMALGGLMLLLTRRSGRAAGVLAIILGFGLWGGAKRPDLLVSADGALIGVMTETGRALSKPKGAGFIAQSWLEDDGDMTAQDLAFARPGLSRTKGVVRADLGAVAVLQFIGKSAPAAAKAACTTGRLVVLSGDWPGGTALCDLYDTARLRKTGALAIYIEVDGLRIIEARQTAGARLWNTRVPRRGRTKDAEDLADN